MSSCCSRTIQVINQNIDPASLTPENCQEIFQCIIDHGTPAQFIEFTNLLGPLFTVNAGTTADAADGANGSETISPGDIIHFWSSDASVNISVDPGSAIIDITSTGGAQTVSLECFEQVTGNPATLAENAAGTFSDGENAQNISFSFTNTNSCAVIVESVTMWIRNPGTDDIINVDVPSTNGGILLSDPVTVPAGTATFEPFVFPFTAPERISAGQNLNIELASQLGSQSVFAVTDQAPPASILSDGSLPAGDFTVARFSGPEILKFNKVTDNESVVTYWDVTDTDAPAPIAGLPAGATCCDDEPIEFPRVDRIDCRQASSGDQIQRTQYSDGTTLFWNLTDDTESNGFTDPVFFGLDQCPLNAVQIAQVIDLSGCSTFDGSLGGLEGGFNSPNTFDPFTPTVGGDHTFTLTGNQPDTNSDILDLLIGTTAGGNDVFDGTGQGITGGSGSIDYTVTLTELIPVYVTIVAPGFAFWNDTSVVSECPAAGLTPADIQAAQNDYRITDEECLAEPVWSQVSDASGASGGDTSIPAALGQNNGGSWTVPAGAATGRISAFSNHVFNGADGTIGWQATNLTTGQTARYETPYVAANGVSGINDPVFPPLEGVTAYPVGGEVSFSPGDIVEIIVTDDDTGASWRRSQPLGTENEADWAWAEAGQINDPSFLLYQNDPVSHRVYTLTDRNEFGDDITWDATTKTVLASVPAEWVDCGALVAAGLTAAHIKGVQNVNTGHVCFRELVSGSLLMDQLDASIDETVFFPDVIFATLFPAFSEVATWTAQAQGSISTMQALMTQLQANNAGGNVFFRLTNQTTGDTLDYGANFGTQGILFGDPPGVMTLFGSGGASLDVNPGDAILIEGTQNNGNQWGLHSVAPSGDDAVWSGPAAGLAGVPGFGFTGNVYEDRGNYAKQVCASTDAVTYVDANGGQVDVSAWEETDCPDTLSAAEELRVQQLIDADPDPIAQIRVINGTSPASITAADLSAGKSTVFIAQPGIQTVLDIPTSIFTTANAGQSVTVLVNSTLGVFVPAIDDADIEGDEVGAGTFAFETSFELFSISNGFGYVIPHRN